MRKQKSIRWFRYTVEDAKAAQAELDEQAERGRSPLWPGSKTVPRPPPAAPIRPPRRGSDSLTGHPSPFSARSSTGRAPPSTGGGAPHAGRWR